MVETVKRCRSVLSYKKMGFIYQEGSDPRIILRPKLTAEQIEKATGISRDKLSDWGIVLRAGEVRIPTFINKLETSGIPDSLKLRRGTSRLSLLANAFTYISNQAAIKYFNKIFYGHIGSIMLARIGRRDFTTKVKGIIPPLIRDITQLKPDDEEAIISWLTNLDIDAFEKGALYAKLVLFQSPGSSGKMIHMSGHGIIINNELSKSIVFRSAGIIKSKIIADNLGLDEEGRAEFLDAVNRELFPGAWLQNRSGLEANAPTTTVHFR